MPAFLVGLVLSCCSGPAVDQSRGPTNYEIADGHFAAREYQLAAEYYGKVVAEMPDNHHAAIRAARAHALAGESDDAMRFVRICHELGRFEFELADLASLRAIPEFRAIRAAAAAELDALRALPIEPVVYLPPGYDPTRRYPLAVMFSGYGQTAGRSRDQEFPGVTAEHGLIWLYVRGTDVIGRDAFHWDFSPAEAERVLRDIDWCLESYAADPERVVLYAFFTGVQRAYPIALAHAERFRGLIVDGGTPPRAELPAVPAGSGLHVYVMTGGGGAEHKARANRALLESVAARGVEFRIETIDAVMDQAALGRAFDWILGVAQRSR